MRKLRKDWEPVADMMERLSMPIPLTGCFEWLGKIGTGGYAYIAYREDGKRYHRKAATVALELAGRPGPEGLEVSHICPEGENRACVNPDHLVWETHSENLKRRKPFARYKGNVCKQGHSLEGMTRASNGGCPICEKARLKAWKEKHAGYDAAYRAANRDRIEANRRARRSRVKEE